MAFDNIVDAKRVLAVLGKRLARFGLTLHPDKTRLVDFRPQMTEGARHPRHAGGGAAMSEIERLWALARYECERDRVPVDVTEATALTERWRGIHAAKQGEALLLEPRSPERRRASWRRLLARSFLSGLIIDALFVGTDRSLNVGLTSSDYVSFAQIGALVYAALALAVLARWVCRLE